MKKGFASLLLILSFTTAGMAYSGERVSAETQTQIVKLFSSDQCLKVREIIQVSQVDQLRPNVMAIVAYCEIPGIDSLAIFLKAEALNPAGDLIYTLHAKYVWKKDPLAASQLWKKVLMLARNPYLVAMAEEYLAGMVKDDKPISLKSTTYFVSVIAGGGTESNVKPVELAYASNVSSPEVGAHARANVQYWLPFGSLSANYFLDVNQSPSAIRYNLLSQEIDIPLAFHAGKNEDIAFRPIGGLTTLGGQPFKSKIGIGVVGIIYRPDYKQSIQGLFYSDHLSIQEIQGEDADHFHFDSTWEFYPKDWILRAVFSIEHATAENTTDYAGYSGDFNNSHTDIGVLASLQKSFLTFTLAFESNLSLRLDSSTSRYALRSTGEIVKTSRIDTDLSFKPSITIPIFPDIQLYGWYEWDQVTSNIGPNDYTNRNFSDQILGLALKANWSSY
jgi:hypothetical protein